MCDPMPDLDRLQEVSPPRAAEEVRLQPYQFGIFPESERYQLPEWNAIRFEA
jgi:hypothetical protein